MRAMMRIGLLGLTLLLAAGPAVPQEDTVELTTVKYAGLKDAVLKHRGKVLLIDVWAEY